MKKNRVKSDLLDTNGGTPLLRGLGYLCLFLLLASCAVRPQPFSEQDLARQAKSERDTLFVGQEPVVRQIDLYDAMARAIKYNLDHKVKILEESVAHADLKRAWTEMLPQLTASAGYSDRSNDPSSVSRSTLTNSVSQEPSLSQEKQQFTANIVHVWNMLDFGVSFLQARQQADNLLIAEEWRRKAVQNIVQDVRQAYWRAVSAQVLLPEMDSLLHEVEAALERSRQLEKLKVEDPVKNLAYQQELLETVKELWAMRRDLSMAKSELAALMNLPPGLSFELGIYPAEAEKYVQNLAVTPLEDLALTKRPELLAAAYQQRINAVEVKKGLLRMLPGLEINVAAQYDDNTYLYNNAWAQAGASLSWNLFELISGPAAIQSARVNQELAGKRHQALAMMVLTQVNLASQRYHLALREFQIANELGDVHQRKIIHAAAALKARSGSEQEEIRNRAEALSARMNQGLAYAELQASLGRIFNSIGFDPAPAMDADLDLRRLALNLTAAEKKQWSFLREKAGSQAVTEGGVAAVSENAVQGGAAGPAGSPVEAELQNKFDGLGPKTVTTKMQAGIMPPNLNEVAVRVEETALPTSKIVRLTTLGRYERAPSSAASISAENLVPAQDESGPGGYSRAILRQGTVLRVEKSPAKAGE